MPEKQRSRIAMVMLDRIARLSSAPLVRQIIKEFGPALGIDLHDRKVLPGNGKPGLTLLVGGQK